MITCVFLQPSVDSDVNTRKYCCIDRCKFKLNNDIHCLTQLFDTIHCGQCTNSFCVTQFFEDEPEKELR